MTPDISIIIPVINEAEQITTQLQALQTLRPGCELLLVDGGSDDDSPAIAAPLVDRIIHSSRGRARQLNAGAKMATADLLLFLHVDTQLPDNAAALMTEAVAAGHSWGRFDVGFDNALPVFNLIACMMNWRSRLSGIATGDQAMFMTQAAFRTVGGFPEIALMEDIAISARLKTLGKPSCLNAKVITSARRWQQYGILKTILLMWRLRLAYFFGADPDQLASRYYRRS